MRNRKNTSKVISFVLILALVISILTPGIGIAENTYAAETVTAKVKVAASAEGAFLVSPQEVTVNSGLAESYGYADAVKKEEAVSALDVFIRTHEVCFAFDSDNVTAEDKEYIKSLIGYSYGSIYDKAFGYDGFGWSFSFAIDNIQPSNGLFNSAYNAYTGELINTSKVYDNQTVEFFIIQDEYFGDVYSYFTYNDAPVKELYIEKGKDIELSARGYSIGYYGCSKPETIINMTQPMSCDMSILEDETLTGITTSSSGITTFNLDKTGDYTVVFPATQAGIYGTEYLLQPYLVLHVVDNLTDAQKVKNAAEQLSWQDIKGDNEVIYNVSQNLTKVTQKAGATVTWTSSNTEIISNDLEVTPKLYEDHIVKLTATITVGEESENKTFGLFVYEDGVSQKPVNVYTESQKKTLINEILVDLSDKEAVKTLDTGLLQDRDYLFAYVSGNNKLTEPEKQVVLAMIYDDAIGELNLSNLGTLCKDILLLTAMDIDPTCLNAYGERINLLEKLYTYESYDSNYYIYVSPYILLAYGAHESFSIPENAPLSKGKVIKQILENQELTGVQTNPYGSQRNSAGDTASIMLGLAGNLNYTDENITAGAIEVAVELANNYILNNLPESGHFGNNVNDAAYITMFNCMMDNDPGLVKKGEKYPDVIDSSLQNYLGKGNGFSFYLGSPYNRLATTDIYRAYLSYANYTDTKAETKANIYDLKGRTLEKNIEIGQKTYLTDLFVKAPDKTLYKVGEAIDLQGMTVTAKYSDGTTKDVTSNAMLSGYEGTLGTKTVIVTYKDNLDGIEITKTASFIVNVSDGSSSQIEHKVTTTVKNANGKAIAGKATVIDKGNTTVMDVLKEVLASAGLTATIKNGNYVVSIDGLGEFDMGGNSGWMVRVNGILIDVSAADYTLQGNEKIEWFYTKDWTSVPGASSAVKEEPKAETSGNQVATTVEIEAKTDSTGKAEAKIETSAVDKAIEDVIKAAAGKTDTKKQVTLDVNADANAKEVTTTIPKNAIKNLDGKVDSVAITTPVGEIKLDSQTLTGLAEQGSDINIGISKKETADGKTAYTVNITSGDKTVGVKGKVTFALEYEKPASEEDSKLVLCKIDENGNKIPVVKSKYADGKLEGQLSELGDYVIEYRNVSFDDTNSHWGKNNIEFLAARDVVKGKSKNSYDPEADVTRGEFVQILFGMAGGKTVGTLNNIDFFDIRENDWFAEAVKWAASMGITLGTGNNNFSPYQKISRQDMSVMIKNYVEKVEGEDLQTKNDSLNFTDNSSVADYAKDAISGMQKAGIINGSKNPDGSYSFNPTSNATRAEAATMLTNYLNM